MWMSHFHFSAKLRRSSIAIGSIDLIVVYIYNWCLSVRNCEDVDIQNRLSVYRIELRWWHDNTFFLKLYAVNVTQRIKPEDPLTEGTVFRYSFRQFSLLFIVLHRNNIICRDRVRYFDCSSENWRRMNTSLLINFSFNNIKKFRDPQSR